MTSVSVPPIKVPIIFHGINSLENLKRFKGKRILIVTDKVARQLIADKLNSLFSGRDTEYFDETEPNPRDTTMIKAGEIACSFKPDLIIGIGGGSVMDTAKAAYFIYGQPSSKLTDITIYKSYNLKAKSKLVLIPTTSGTGSENSFGLVFTDSKSGKKTAAMSSELLPWAVVLDPQLTLSMPEQLTISSGLDAMAQAIESSSSILANDFLQALNLYSIKVLFKYLPIVAKEGAKDLNTRHKIHNAASMIGISLGHAGLGIGHACGHALGVTFDIPHGLSVGLMLPYTIEYNRPNCEERYIDILENLHVIQADDPTFELSSLVKQLLRKLQVPESVEAAGISRKAWEQNLDKLVEYSASDMCLLTNPRTVDKESIRRVLQCAYEGKSIDF